ncbi:hypothetical protein L6452_14464 [Arctium lappa]|uniref:Uncharacterized protein n=1 Tax=Arctium lappa TaxID=4217 RepID=A0ACB9CLK2_ARCLA|nr:hypothetical protein L6452_14464 [Arctium lappa]
MTPIDPVFLVSIDGVSLASVVDEVPAADCTFSSTVDCTIWYVEFLLETSSGDQIVQSTVDENVQSAAGISSTTEHTIPIVTAQHFPKGLWIQVKTIYLDIFRLFKASSYCNLKSDLLTYTNDQDLGCGIRKIKVDTHRAYRTSSRPCC